jgi:hypothetical protein
MSHVCHLVTNSHINVNWLILYLSDMVSHTTQGARKSRGKCKKVAALVAGLMGGIVTMQAHHDLCKVPMHTSKLTRGAWVRELLAGHPVQFQIISASSVISHIAFFGDGASSFVARATVSGVTFSLLMVFM